ncbi:YajQ family cyclic di-GMP-binding protein [Balneolaceae bacterium ANBcel3]|nr:YajQ family cyclic di-GMP-binding protein [Balneolaceae bacterium ANBcel3]
MPSFDIVNEIDPQEVENSVHNTLKEVSTRYDFKGLHTELSYNSKAGTIHLLAAESMKMKAVREMLNKHMIKRGLNPKVLEYGNEEGTSSGALKQNASLKVGINRDTAKKIVKEIKNLKLKVQPAIQEDKLRVTGKKIDELQDVIQFLKTKDFGVPLQFVNMKS